MRKIFFITFAVILVQTSFSVSAQEARKDRKSFDKEAFEARRNAFIVTEVGLTPEEAERFIPLCDELRKKRFEVGRECRKLTKQVRSKENPTDADYNEVIDKCLEVEIKEAELEKEYYKKFKQILSPEKLYKYREAEFKFVREFMGHNKKKEKQKKHIKSS